MTKSASVSIFIISIMAFGCTRTEHVEVRQLSQQEFLSSAPTGALILDVRSQGEYRSGHVPKAVNIPHDELEFRLAELSSELDRPVILYCKSGRRAGMAASVLLEAGHTNILHLAGDMNAWKAKGLPTE